MFQKWHIILDDFSIFQSRSEDGLMPRPPANKLILKFSKDKDFIDFNILDDFIESFPS